MEVFSLAAFAAAASMWGHKDDFDAFRTLVVDLIKAAAPTHPALLANVKGVDQLPLDQLLNAAKHTAIRGKYDRNTGVLNLAATGPDGKPLPREVICGVIAHELAHATQPSGDHGDAWRIAFQSLLQIATTQLGWKIQLECSACGMYKVCTTGQCPLCDWKACKPRVLK